MIQETSPRLGIDHQKEGNGNLYTVLRIQNRSVSLHPRIFRHLINSPRERAVVCCAGWRGGFEERAVVTYPENGRVIWYPRSFLRCGVLLVIPSNADVLHITSSKDDVLVDTGGGGDFLGGVATAPF